MAGVAEQSAPLFPVNPKPGGVLPWTRFVRHRINMSPLAESYKLRRAALVRADQICQNSLECISGNSIIPEYSGNFGHFLGNLGT